MLLANAREQLFCFTNIFCPMLSKTDRDLCNQHIGFSFSRVGALKANLIEGEPGDHNWGMRTREAMLNDIRRSGEWILLAGVLASGILFSTAHAQSVAAAAKPQPVGTPSHYQPSRFAKRAKIYYNEVWGVDSLSVKLVESGEVVRFAYRVLDPDRAKTLNDKKLQPSLIDPQAGVKLVIPELENIGLLRQTNTPEAGRSYWMAFSNKGNRVKRGDHVNVVIGNFRADGLAVE